MLFSYFNDGIKSNKYRIYIIFKRRTPNDLHVV